MPKFNTTQLYIDKAEDRGIVHRDYLAHCLRWTHILKYAKIGMNILDVGCGVNAPLANMFYTNRYKPNLYCGIDMRRIEPTIKWNFPHHLQHEFDVTLEADWDHLMETVSNKWDIITCFEVIEHMEKADGIRLLENIAAYGDYSLLCNPFIFISTPIFNGSAAANHVHEWEYDELYCEIEKLFKIENVFGTFASQRDILPVLSESEREVWNKLRAYYDSNVLSILLAPLHPKYSRNAIWRVRLK